MRFVSLALALFALVVVIYLFRVELIRFRSDPSPAPPLPPEKASRETWHARMAMLIASLSILGAFNVWLASTTFGAASDLSQQLLQDQTQYQTELAIQNSRIEFGARLSLQYQDHLYTEMQLYKTAQTDRNAGDVNDALQLEAEARIEGAQERALDPGFLYYSPDNQPNGDGAVTFNRAEEETVAQEENRDLITLNAAHISVIESQVTKDRNEGQAVVLATALFVTAIFFLTVANLGWRHRRVHTMLPSLLAVLAGAVVLFTAVV